MNFDLGHINKIAAVSAKMMGEEHIYHYQILKKKKGEIIFDKAGKSFPNLRSLIKKMNNRIPVVMHVHGKGILNRMVPNKENYRHALLMNTRLEDFYFTDYLEDKNAYSSVVRRDAVNELLNAFEEKQIQVISFATGPFIGVPLIPFLGKEFMTIDDIRLDYMKDELQSFEKSEDVNISTFIGEEMVSHDMMGAVALGINYFNPSRAIVLPEERQVQEINLKEAKQKNIFYRFATGLIAFFLLILTLNYFYLDHVNGKIENNYLLLAEFEDQLAKLSTLEDEKGRKEKLLRGSGLLNRNFLSYYLMEISNSIPRDVTLDQVVLRPLMDEIKRRHKIEFNEQLVMVTGKSKSSEILSKWIDRLKEKEWLATVDILDYTYKKNAGNFELEIVVK